LLAQGTLSAIGVITADQLIDPAIFHLQLLGRLIEEKMRCGKN
jgi:hypothetical protein